MLPVDNAIRQKFGWILHTRRADVRPTGKSAGKRLKCVQRECYPLGTTGGIRKRRQFEYV
jgi:hypothetical protein